MSKEIEKVKTTSDLIQEAADENRLTPYQQLFLVEYSKSGKMVDSIKYARKTLRMKIGSNNETMELEAKNLLMMSSVKKALSKIKTAVSSQTEMIIANTGADLAEAFNKLSVDTSKIDRMDSRITYYDKLIDEAMAMGDTGSFVQLEKMQQGVIKTREKMEETLRKNLALVHEMTGSSRTKQIIRAGALNINMGNGTINAEGETAKHLESIEGDFVEADIPDLDELS